MRVEIARIIAAVVLTTVGGVAQLPVGHGSARGQLTPPAGTGATGTAYSGRRDLFVPPPGVAAGASRPSSGVGGGTGTVVPLPPMPVPEASGPMLPAGSLPALPAQGQGRAAAPQVPPVSLRGIVLGATPQAVLISNGAYTIVTVGQTTPWGTVRAIAATMVTLETSAGPHTLTFDMRSQPPKTTPPGSTR